MEDYNLGPAAGRCSVELPIGMDEHTAYWIPAIAAAGKIVEIISAPLAVGRTQLEYVAILIWTAAVGGAEEISVSIELLRY